MTRSIRSQHVTVHHVALDRARTRSSLQGGCGGAARRACLAQNGLCACRVCVGWAQHAISALFVCVGGPMGTAYGGKGFNGRAANGDRQVGTASCRREQYTMASCQNPPLKRSPARAPRSRVRKPRASGAADVDLQTRFVGALGRRAGGRGGGAWPFLLPLGGAGNAWHSTIEAPQIHSWPIRIHLEEGC